MRVRCFAAGSERIQDLVIFPKIYAERFLKTLRLGLIVPAEVRPARGHAPELIEPVAGL